MPLLNVFGGKITTYRKLAENSLAKLEPYFSAMKGDWTAGVALPGGDFPVDGVAQLIADLMGRYPFLSDRWAKRLVRAYGTETRDILGDAQTVDDLGPKFEADLTGAEIRWLMEREYARTAEDVVWRRSRLGLRMTPEGIAALDAWMKARSTKPKSMTEITGKKIGIVNRIIDRLSIRQPKTR